MKNFVKEQILRVPVPFFFFSVLFFFSLGWLVFVGPNTQPVHYRFLFVRLRLDIESLSVRRPYDPYSGEIHEEPRSKTQK